MKLVQATKAQDYTEEIYDKEDEPPLHFLISKRKLKIPLLRVLLFVFGENSSQTWTLRPWNQNKDDQHLLLDPNWFNMK